MSDVSNCPYPRDYSFLHRFTGSFQVSNATSSIYSNLYLNPPANTSWGLATLTPTPQQNWFMDGGLMWMCSRGAYLVQKSAYNSSVWSGAQINIDATGHAPVNVITEWNSEVLDNVTRAFYVEDLSVPLSLGVRNPGSYYGADIYLSNEACTDENGEIGVYYRQSITTTPTDCKDVVFNVKEA